MSCFATLKATLATESLNACPRDLGHHVKLYSIYKHLVLVLRRRLSLACEDCLVILPSGKQKWPLFWAHFSILGPFYCVVMCGVTCATDSCRLFQPVPHRVIFQPAKGKLGIVAGNFVVMWFVEIRRGTPNGTEVGFAFCENTKFFFSCRASQCQST